MNLYSNFKDRTGTDLLTACQKHCMQYGYFIADEDDIEDIHDTPEFMEFYDRLIDIYTKPVLNISQYKVLPAIDISLENSLLTTNRCRTKHTWLSEYMFTDEECIDICLKYGEFAMNPVAFIFDKDNQSKYRSVLLGRKLKLVGLSVRNGNNYRHSRFFLQRRPIDRIDIEKIEKTRYHPIVWYLLREGKLDEYRSLYLNQIEYGEKPEAIS